MEQEPAIRRRVGDRNRPRSREDPGSSKAYFTDFFREYDQATDAIVPRPTFLMSPNPSQNCYDCHKSAVIPIRPKATYSFSADGQLVPEQHPSQVLPRLDNLIASYGRRRSMGYMDPTAYGPSLGAAQTTRTDQFIAAATADHSIPTESFAAIKANMSCASCHANFGKLNYLLGVRSDGDVKSFEAKQGLIQSFIEQGIMPPGNTLSPAERHALWECVSKEYFDPVTQTGAFVDWLRGGRDS